ncbi:MAG: hypothetical protein KQH59_06875 [Desulfobulbaceae bacterium]|nr:hypothetical protein [Desulfobulbaceae bacterium]
MYDKHELCKKIAEIYPDIGECGIGIEVDYSDDKNVWIVHLKKGEHELDHHLEIADADHCMDGEQCVGLGLEIAQLKSNIKGQQF